jgi:hypothetical protein
MNSFKSKLGMSALALAIMVPAGAAAQSTQNGQDTQPNSSGNASASSEANQMVAAQAAVVGSLDAKDAKPGEAVSARLVNKVQLKNGQELPSGTVLMGKVAQDDMNVKGKSKLALRFDQAQLKDGKTVPVKATIVGIYSPGSGPANSYLTAPGNQVPNGWTSQEQQVDQVGALSGVDLHSRIASSDSGVLVSTRKDDIKLKSGTELALAIGPGEGSQMGSNSGSRQ